MSGDGETDGDHDTPDPHADQPIETAGAPPAAATAAVILLHGRGGSASHVLRLADDFHVRGALYLAPQASGSVWVPRGPPAAPEENEPYLGSALDLVDRAMDLAADAGVPPERTLLFGFSQGATLAGEYALSRPRRYGGLAMLAGGLLDPSDREGERSEPSRSLDGTPALLAAGEDDPHVSAEIQSASAAVLERAGAAVDSRRYDGLGHYVNDDEVAWVRERLEDVA